MTRFPLFALLVAAHVAPAFACGDGSCEPPPPPPLPVVVAPDLIGGKDRDPSAPSRIIHYGFCCQIEGKMRVSTAWLRDPVTAHEQCQAREERMQSLPECPDRIRRQEGGA